MGTSGTESGDGCLYTQFMPLLSGGGGGVNSHILGYGMCRFFRVLFDRKINLWVYFMACNKFLGQDFSLE